MLRLQCVTVDCTNPKLLADFWSEALDWEIGEVKEHEAWLQPKSKAAQEVHYPDLLFYYSPDSKKVKNRLHLDLRPTDQASEVERLISLGATHVEIGQSEDQSVSWVVLADPEGNEFCVLKAL
jgi:predicted enzyme related to lactoylglutathione lyase